MPIKQLRAAGLVLVGGVLALTVAMGPAYADSEHSGAAAHGAAGAQTGTKRVHATKAGKAALPRNNKPAKADVPRTAEPQAAAATAAVKSQPAAPMRALSAVAVAKAEVAQASSSTTAPTAAVKIKIESAADTATTTATKAASTTVARAPTLLNFFGSLMFNVLGVAIQLFAGQPIVPKGSTVTVKVSSLTMPDTGQKVVADWYFPQNATSSTRLIYFQHGFMAVSSMYSYTLAALAQQTDSIIVAPTLSSNAFDAKAEWLGGAPDQQAVADLFVGNRAALTASARAAGFDGTLPTDFVLAGHSLGGGLVSSAAGYLVDNGAAANLKGVLLMDAVDLNDVVPTALAKLTGSNSVPVYDISSDPYVWNRDGLVGQELQAARPGQFTGVMLTGGRHIDALQGPNPILQFAEYLVAGFSQPRNVAAEKTLAIGWVNDMFAGTHVGIYGTPQQSIEIPTVAGTATAVVLPFTSSTPVVATPWDGIANVILNSVLQFAVYTPLAA